MYVIVKILVSALIIGIVTEVARKYPSYGGIIAALPLVSLLSLIWLSFQGESLVNLSKFTTGVLIGIPATVVLLVIVGICLKLAMPLVFSIGLGVLGWASFLFVQQLVMKVV
ncbi:DUF3147 family protein [Bacillus sp. SM2101]|uniref:DUF3147 family protein n=1 Tax=Bacillus sp. SM2101 TaxID=2805366 RepID=UPI001BDF024C|nr:DUF3147 family protein [Bacillus sp. SM2101]